MSPWSLLLALLAVLLPVCWPELVPEPVPEFVPAAGSTSGPSQVGAAGVLSEGAGRSRTGAFILNGLIPNGLLPKGLPSRGPVPILLAAIVLWTLALASVLLGRWLAPATLSGMVADPSPNSPRPVAPVLNATVVPILLAALRRVLPALVLLPVALLHWQTLRADVDAPPWWMPAGGLSGEPALADTSLTDTPQADTPLADTPRRVDGEVVGLPVLQRGERGQLIQRFEFQVERLDGEPLSSPRLLRVSSWDAGWQVRAGERWRMTLRIRSARGTVNFHGFDYERWLFAHHVAGLASVVVRQPAERLAAASPWSPAVWREALRDRLMTLDQRLSLRHGELIAGLAFAADDAIADHDWQAFRLTGTTHLVAVSGLHIVLVAGIAGWLGRRLWRLSAAACRRWPAPHAGDLLALLTALAYVALAGFALPAVRAGLMLAAVLLPRLLLWRIAPLTALCGVLWVMLLADACAVLEPGFWLSGAAVALIFLVAWGRVPAPLAAQSSWFQRGLRGSRDALRLQFALSLALLPLTGFWFGEWAWLSPLVNVPAVPWVSLVSTPLALLGCLLLPLSEALAAPVLTLADWSLTPFMAGIRTLADWPPARWQLPAIDTAGLLAMAFGVLLLLWPASRWRIPGLLLVAAAVLPALGRAPPGYVLTLFDVGQGTALSLQTPAGPLIYDAGPASPDFDTATRIIIPQLAAEASRRPALFVLSHDDRDHAGGAPALAALWPAGQTLAGESGVLPQARRCVAGERFALADLNVTVLAPAADMRAEGNAASCVLNLQLGATRILLTGDIGRREEAWLLGRPELLRADWLLLAHHGSRHSSTATFLDAVAPHTALISAGYRNRHGHPHPDVLQRLSARRIAAYNTAEQGALRLHFAADGRLVAAQSARCTARLWRQPPAACRSH